MEKFIGLSLHGQNDEHVHSRVTPLGDILSSMGGSFTQKTISILRGLRRQLDGKYCGLLVESVLLLRPVADHLPPQNGNHFQEEIAIQYRNHDVVALAHAETGLDIVQSTECVR